MAEVHFDPSIEISIPDSAFHHARRFECNGDLKHECNCDCHFTHSQEAEDEIDCKCRYKGNWKGFKK